MHVQVVVAVGCRCRHTNKYVGGTGDKEGSTVPQETTERRGNRYRVVKKTGGRAEQNRKTKREKSSKGRREASWGGRTRENPCAYATTAVIRSSSICGVNTPSQYYLLVSKRTVCEQPRRSMLALQISAIVEPVCCHMILDTAV